MDPLSLIIGLTNAGVGLLLIVLLLPLLYRKVARNFWYGFRFPGSMRDDEIWYAVNQYGARQMILWSAGLILFGIACCFLSLSDSPVSAVIGGSAAAVVLIPAVQAWLYDRRLRLERDEQAS